MANITTTIHFTSASDFGGGSPWTNPTNTAVSDGVYGTVLIGPSAFSGQLDPVAPASEFAGLGGRIPISLTWKMRLGTDDAARAQFFNIAGEEAWVTNVQIAGPIGTVQTFPTFTPFSGTTAQKKAVLQSWVDNGFLDTTFIVLHNVDAGVARTVSIDWITFDLVTASASSRNRRRQLAMRRGAACNRS